MAIQPFIRRGTRSNATARRLIASSQQVAPSVLRTTVELDDDMPAVISRIAYHDALIAGLNIVRGQFFFYVVSPKFAARYYILSHKGGAWFSSSPESSIKLYCIRQVEAMEQAA